MPAEVQEVYEAERGDERLPPLVLIHDGGGTIFQYFMLGYLGRQTYGIASPYFESGSKPEGGLPELAKEYVKAIQQEIGSGPVIIGGWSFGGMIAVEMARLFAEAESDVQVVGILMVDSSCPWSKGEWLSRPAQPNFRPTTTEKMKDLTLKSFSNAREMIKSWEKPAEFAAPPVVLIQAEEIRHLDKEDGRLGWSEMSSLKFLGVEVVPGDHFSMFSDERVDGVTEKIRSSCKLFDVRVSQ